MANSAIFGQVQGVATATSPGLVSTSDQTFSGTKSLQNGVAFGITNITTAVTLSSTHAYVRCGGSTGYTVTLPDAATIASGREYIIKSILTTPGQLVTVATTSSQTIDGSTTPVTLARYNTLRVINNGSGWDIV
ncbi:hypothetical protein UFOVP244_162 [uncultured Caudovirales phage]|uniref:Uncharacterized protein n=1 Tax=uncultured Caudovirales phage TaxID=2100421 RepID=A0A6J7WUH9_9CAUD|nr:hypothetical protein UFOVP244_162 [uncultured Caudovirales phage]